MDSQWRFPLDALRQTPSAITLEEEMLRRQRGVDWLMRVGATLNMGLGPCLTAATFLHRFYMRRMLEDYHEFEIAATCLFLASKTEENGKRLEDLVTVALAKLHSIAPSEVAGTYDNEAKQWEHIILTYEEVLLEVLCFDFDIRYPHAYLADIVATYDPDTSDPYTNNLIDCAWSVAHDSYRTPLCVLVTPQAIAAAAFLFAQCLAEGPNGPSLTKRLHSPRPNDPDWRFILNLSEDDTIDVSIALTILCQYYGSYVRKDKSKPDVSSYKLIQRPSLDIDVPILFSSPDAPQSIATNGATHSSPSIEGAKTPANPKSIPSTPFPLAVPTSPRTDNLSNTPNIDVY